MNRSLLLLYRLLLPSLFVAAARPVAAQHAFAGGSSAYDASVPTPSSVLGYELGERFTPHHLLVRYLERVAAASPRILLDTVALTFEGREVLLVTATSEANQQRLDAIRSDAARLADPGAVAAAELATVIERTPAIAWLGYTVHGNEASGTEAAIALVYQLAAGSDEATRRILERTVVLIDPLQNPDGHERHVQDVLRRRGALGVPVDPSAMIHQGTWPGARTSHYQFDLNRDWFLHSHPETRGRVATFLRWWPHVAVDLHEMGSNSTYFFAPPMEPVNKNVHASIPRWWDIFAAANAEAFDAHGWSYFRREGYDEFYPGYGVSWPILIGSVGMTYEQASSRGGAVMRSDGTVLTLRQAAWQHYTAAWATLETTARLARERVRDYAEFRRSAVAESMRAPVRSIVLERDASGRADSLARRLVGNGIAVQLLPEGTEVREATAFGGTRAGTVRLAGGGWAVDMAQPQGRLARALLEPDAQLDSTFIHEELESRRTGQADRFYDVTAWSMPYTFRVRAWTTRGPVRAGRGVVADIAGDEQWRRHEEAIAGARDTASHGRYGYAFAPGSEASLRVLAALLADSVRVWYAPRSFRAGGHAFAAGAFVVRAAANDSSVHERLRELATASGARIVALASAAVDEGTDLGSNSVVPMRPVRVALLGGSPVSGYSFGFAWYAFDQRLRFPVTALDADAVRGGALVGYDVLVVPSASPDGLQRTLGGPGEERIAAWVRAGGTLVTLDEATAWLADERLGLSRLRVGRDTARADTAVGAPLPTSVPGAIVRTVADTLSPLLAGIRDTEIPVLAFRGRIYRAPRNVRPGETVLRYAPEPRLRLAGYLWPEVPARLAGTPYLWTERVGQGRVIAFAGDPNFRDMWRGLLPVFANAVLLMGGR